MNSREQLYQRIRSRRSFLCIGLDPDMKKIPGHLLGEDDPIFTFNRTIIEATHTLAVAYKPNIAFYEAEGASGWKSLEKTIRFIRKTDPGAMIIADGKRGDIGNTSSLYARTFFENLGCDALTVAPYMGYDSVQPFLKYPGKWVILLAVTSNKSSEDFQFLKTYPGEIRLFEAVIRKSRTWCESDQMMYVVGATRASMLHEIRKIVPDHFFLVPGIGTQGGDLEEVAASGMNSHCGLLVNASRSIIYASSDRDFGKAAAAEAGHLQRKMESLLDRHGLL
ncbi:MAG: orotidine-5'-phosphate decarboxylase [Bacteroidales bacterium]|nr:orotidine-5'-phosphate decarboxylase [Bacteroidales bacterium]